MSRIGSKFAAGESDGTHLTLTRVNGTDGTCDVFLMRGTLSDNGDTTFDITFPGS